MRLSTALGGAFRLAALTQPLLTDVAGGLDVTLSALGADEDFATALVIGLEPGTVDIVNCGHHPPLIGRPGQMQGLALRAYLPLGLGGPRVAQRFPWPAGHLLIAFTDGLVEARDGNGRTPDVGALINGLGSAPPERLVEAMLHGADRFDFGRRDDIAVVAALRREAPPPDNAAATAYSSGATLLGRGLPPVSD